MNKQKLILYIVLIAALAVFTFIFVRFGDQLYESALKVNTRDSIEDLKAVIAEDDYKLYWAGAVPSRLKDLKITEIKPEHIDYSVLPIKSVSRTEITYDKDNHKIYNQKYIDQECPEKSVIVINGATGFTDEERKLFEQCCLESGTKLLVIGKDSVTDYRNYLFLPVGSMYDFSSMELTYIGEPTRDPLDPEAVADTESVEFTETFLKYLAGVLGH